MRTNGAQFGSWIKRNRDEISPPLLPVLEAIRAELVKTDDSLHISPSDEFALTRKSANDDTTAHQIVARMRDKLGLS
jgi:hypothetical protein